MSAKGNGPNIVIMYADDLGFGDVGCYGATDIPAPNVDRLAMEGLKFVNGYATAATCTPSRYSLLTGSYPWRNPRAAILAGDAPMIIEPETRTLPGMLRHAGYRTGVVGKWHLGLGKNDLDWNKDISVTPNDIGFDFSYIMAATNDRVPCVYVENHSVVNREADDPIEVTYDPNKAFSGQSTGRRRKTVLRQGNWVLIPPNDGPAVNADTHIELGNSPDLQLFDLSLDIGQARNVATVQGGRVKQMLARLAGIRQGRRTRPLDSAAAKPNPGVKTMR